MALAWPASTPAATGAALIEELVLGAALAQYRFDRYKSSTAGGDDGEAGAGEPKGIADLHILLPRRLARGVGRDAFDRAVERAETCAAAVCLTRDLVNEPANVLSPETLAAKAREVAGAHESLSVIVLERKEIEERGMGLLLGVAQGARSEPRVIHLRYDPPGGGGERVALVGKGITFDSGGLDIKTRGNMIDMKSDMAGAAAVLGVASALPVLRPAVRVDVVIPAAENMTGANAYRPGDILKAMSGKTVEILNTDAEGRLALADGIAYALAEGAEQVIDLATLTGACAVALGEYTAGLFSNRRGLARALLRASVGAGESLWELPTDSRLKREIESPVADLKNIGGRYGGAIHAALFLEAFVDKKPWAHLDIAGPAFASSARITRPRGGTGFGVLTVLRYLESL